MNNHSIKRFNVISTHQTFMLCEHDNQPCRLLMNDVSRNFHPGTYNLLVEDRSIYTEFGYDLVYDPLMDVTHSTLMIGLKHFTFNQALVNECRKINGKYDKKSMTWFFSYEHAIKVDELESIYNSPQTKVRINITETVSELNGPVLFLGYTLARAFSYESKIQFGDGVRMEQGKAYSGGSKKNWKTTIEKGSIFILDVPVKLLELNQYPTKSNQESESDSIVINYPFRGKE